MPFEIDVVILTWNDGALLDSAVASALDSESVRVRVWVVDNGSRDPVRPGPDRRITLVRSEINLGVAPGRIVGIQRGTAPLVCLLDSDAVLSPNCLATLAQAVAADDAVAMAVPVFSGQDPEMSAGRGPSVWRKLARGLGCTDRYASVARDDSRSVWDVDFGIGACQLFRRSSYNEVGGLDGTIFYGPEDVDLCLRMRARSWRIVQVANALCGHPARRRHRTLLTHEGIRHTRAVVRHLWRHRSAASHGAAPC